MWRAHFLHFHHGSSGRSSSFICAVSCDVQRQRLSLRTLDVTSRNYSAISTGGTSLSTTVFRISIHSVRFCLLISSRGRLYWGGRLVTKMIVIVMKLLTRVHPPESCTLMVWHHHHQKTQVNVSQLGTTITWKRAYRILKICFCTSTESTEWSGSSWMKRSFSMGMKMCMAATRGARSSGFLYLFDTRLVSSPTQRERSDHIWSTYS